MNKVILMGRLTRDPDVRYSTGERQTAVAKYTLAVDRRYSRDGERGTDFIGCTAFGRAAEFAEKYLHQGTKICVVGRIQTGSYVNKDGAKVYTTDVIVEEQEFAESKAASQRNAESGYGGSNYGQGSYGGNGSYGGGYHPQGAPEPSTAAGDGFMNIPEGIDDELPFT